MYAKLTLAAMAAAVSLSFGATSASARASSEEILDGVFGKAPSTSTYELPAAELESGNTTFQGLLSEAILLQLDPLRRTCRLIVETNPFAAVLHDYCRGYVEAYRVALDPSIAGVDR